VNVDSGVLIDIPRTPPPHPPEQAQSSINKFDYFTEIEELFIRRRGKHLWLCSIDWVLMERWKETGIPLYTVLKAIEIVFDRHDARRQQRSVKSLLYCQEEVEAQFSEWLQGQVGVHTEMGKKSDTEDKAYELEEDLPFTRTAILDHLTLRHATLMKVRDEWMTEDSRNLAETFEKVSTQLQKMAEDFKQTRHPNAEELEALLIELETQIDQALRNHLSQAQLASEIKNAEDQLQPYRSRMDRDVYEQMLDRLVIKHLHEEWGIPRLSLFYL
jgi:hypothetical protein